MRETFGFCDTKKLIDNNQFVELSFWIVLSNKRFKGRFESANFFKVMFTVSLLTKVKVVRDGSRLSITTDDHYVFISFTRLVDHRSHVFVTQSQ